MKKSIPIIRERESEAFILGNGRELEFPLTPGRCPNYPPDNGGDDDRDGEDDYSDMPAATIPPSVWQSANLQILCQPPQRWVGNKDKGSLV